MPNKPAAAREVIGDYLAEQCTVIIDSEAALRAGEDVIHKARVAVRRLRSTIRVFADLFDAEQAARLEEELVWWAGLLGKVRDMDILTGDNKLCLPSCRLNSFSARSSRPSKKSSLSSGSRPWMMCSRR
jgi:CHAD domain-containing protein